MKLTKQEQRQITAQREHNEARAASIVEARTIIRKLLSEQSPDRVLRIAKQIEQAQRIARAPRPRCTCDQQWTDPRCPARRAGYRPRGGAGSCSVPPAVWTVELEFEV